MPTSSDISSDEPRSGEFFGQPEQLAVSETVQLTFDFSWRYRFQTKRLGHQDSPTFSVPNYLNARENGVVTSTSAAEPIAQTRTSHWKRPRGSETGGCE